MATLLDSVIRRHAVIVLLGCLLGCRGGDTPHHSSASSTAPGFSTAGLPVTPPLPGDNDPAPPSPAAMPENLSLTERLAREAASRPQGAIRTEELVAALQAKGVAVARTRQVLGKTLHARYCGIAVTRDGLVASVCEFGSAPEAAAALKDSEQRFGKAMPNRRLATNGKSLLTIANLRDSAAQEASAVEATFAALRAT